MDGCKEMCDSAQEALCIKDFGILELLAHSEVSQSQQVDIWVVGIIPLRRSGQHTST